jgi:hypothetical protein
MQINNCPLWHFESIFKENEEVKQNSSLVQFYTFVLFDANRIRRYGYCRSTQNGYRVLCLIRYLNALLSKRLGHLIISKPIQQPPALVQCSYDNTEQTGNHHKRKRGNLSAPS